ncbi:RICIN domain-containing protein [Bacteroides heparinolyticus]|uniref:RICIN domain-containing protein n=2 Tax=Prevotella heparinolytica TaxID=28113 RepID=UPI0035A124AF
MKKSIKNVILGATLSLLVFSTLLSGFLCYDLSFAADDYPDEYRNFRLDQADKWNFCARNCTSFAAWCLNSRNGVKFHNYFGGVHWGHAKNWKYAAQKLGYGVDKNPRVGDIAYWGAGKYGHVAYVTAVNGDSVTVEEYNFKVTGGYGTRTLNKSAFDAFLHIGEPINNGNSNNNGNYVENYDYYKSAWVNGKYTGEWSAGAPNGKGILIYSDNSKMRTIAGAIKYEGMFVNGLRQGQGTTYFDGRHQEGHYYGLYQAGKIVFDGQMVYTQGEKKGHIHVFKLRATSATEDEFIDERWILPETVYDIPSGSASEVADGEYYIAFEFDESKFVTTSGIDKNGENIYIWENKPDYSKKNIIWRLERQADDTFKVISASNGLVMDASGGNSANYDTANIQVWEWHGGANQRWLIVRAGDSYSFVSKNNGFYADVEGRNTANGTNIYQYHPNGSAAQRFKLIKAGSLAPKAELAIITESLSEAVQGADYTYQLSANLPHIIFEITSGALPKGLMLSDSGAISGTPEEHGSFTFAISAKLGNETKEKTFTLVVGPNIEAPVFVTEILEHGTVDKPYDGSVISKGEDVTYKIKSGKLPNGLYFKDGYIYGTPVKAGVYSFEIEASNSAGSVQKHFTIEISESLEFKLQKVFQKIKKYKNKQFGDVSDNQWYAAWVKKAYEYGLVNGVSESKFNPHGYITKAEIVAIAARIHSMYSEKTIAELEGAWYQKYLLYAASENIIDMSLVNKITEKATRAECVEILSKALPEDVLPAVNEVEDNAIPDVSIDDKYADAIYAFYRAGILSGTDITGKFNYSSYVIRAEIAKIIVGMVEGSARTKFQLTR